MRGEAFYFDLSQFNFYLYEPYLDMWCNLNPKAYTCLYVLSTNKNCSKKLTQSVQGDLNGPPGQSFWIFLPINKVLRIRLQQQIVTFCYYGGKEQL